MTENTVLNRTAVSGNQLGYRPALDGLRALAIAPLVTVHAFGWPKQGSLGVDIFFVLSGFLITTLLLEERASTGTISFRGFYRRRAARLVPALALLLAIYAIGDRFAHPLAIVFAMTFTMNIGDIVTTSWAVPGIGHLWSLAQEEQFYLVWPPLLLFVTRVRPALLTRVIGVMILLVVIEKIALLGSGADTQRIYMGPDSHADPILIGCLFGALFSSGVRGRLSRLAGPAVVLVIASFVASEWFSFLAVRSPLRTVFAFACGVLVFSAASAPSWTSFALSFRPFTSLGRISYSLYLWHLLVLTALAAANRTGHRPSGPAAAAVALSIIIAAASFYVVEQPLRRRWRGKALSHPSLTESSHTSGIRPVASLHGAQ
jgi:peptidoglycan/LPS O-acetylase OafA/YrhL